MKKKTRKRTDARQKRFIQEYLVDLNATQAALRAGYSQKTAYSQGNRLLKKDEVQKAIARAQKKRAERTEITQDLVLQELRPLIVSDMKNYVRVAEGGEVQIIPLEQLSPGASKAIRKISEKRTIREGTEGDGKSVLVDSHLTFELWDKGRAIELGMRHLGMFNDKLDLSGKVEVLGSLTITDLRKSLSGYKDAK